jgi:hypothetical protein
MTGRRPADRLFPSRVSRRLAPLAAVGLVSVLALGACSSSSTSSPRGGESTPSASTSAPVLPDSIGDLGIGTHIGSDGLAHADPEVAQRLSESRRFDTVYLDATRDTTPDVGILRSWLADGVSPVVDLTFKNGPFTMAQIADDSPEAHAYFDTFTAGLASLAQRAHDLHNGTRVYFSFEHESVVKINQGKFVFAGYAGRQPTFEEAAAAWNRVQALVAQRAPDVVRLYWFGGSAVGEDEYADLLQPDLIQMATFDPYRRFNDSPDANAATLWGPRIDDLLSQPWMRKPDGGLKPWGLTEWGTDRQLGDASNARFVSETLRFLSSRGARFAIYFDRADGPNDFRFTDGSEPQTLRAYLDTVSPS